MPRNVELIQRQFGSQEPLPSIELADNALKLGGIAANLYALKSELNGEVDVLEQNIDEVIEELRGHENDDVRHLTQAQIDKISAAINAAQALSIAQGAITSATPGIVDSAIQGSLSQAESYTDTIAGNLTTTLKNYADGKAGTAESNAKDYADGKDVTTLASANGYTDTKVAGVTTEIGNLNLPTYVDPVTGETETVDMGETLATTPNNLIKPEYFYRFKNLIDNSSFEVFNGNTMIPIGWDNGVVSPDASMFETYSLKLTSGQTAKQTTSHQPDARWLKGAYTTDKAILAFYHKFDEVTVKIYDVVNESYITLTQIDENLEQVGSPSTSITFDETENWNQYRCMVIFTPAQTTQKMRIEFTCESGGTEGECYIDAPSLEPYEDGKYPSIYKAGRYSISAYQLLNPPPADVDRFTPLEHLSINNNSTYDTKGNITYQELERADGTLAITRTASNPDTNGYYQTIVETFYKADGSTVNYTDTYTLSYTSTGSILTQSKTTTEVVG